MFENDPKLILKTFFSEKYLLEFQKLRHGTKLLVDIAMRGDQGQHFSSVLIDSFHNIFSKDKRQRNFKNYGYIPYKIQLKLSAIMDSILTTVRKFPGIPRLHSRSRE